MCARCGGGFFPQRKTGEKPVGQTQHAFVQSVDDLLGQNDLRVFISAEFGPEDQVSARFSQGHKARQRPGGVSMLLGRSAEVGLVEGRVLQRQSAAVFGQPNDAGATSNL